MLALDVAPPPARRSGSPAARRAELGALASIAALVAAHDVWAAQALLLVLLLSVPGLLLLRALRVPGAAIVRFPVYVPCASLVVLIASGLTVDLAGLAWEAPEPLRAWPLLIGLELTCLGLFAAGATAPAEADVPWAELRPRLVRLWPLALPLAAAAGALLLTNGQGAEVAIGAMAASLLTVLACALIAVRLSAPQLWLVLYGVGLAAAWSFSLRGHFLYGFDISSEYHVAAKTFADAAWRTPHPHDAYGAMLSLTVLPASLQALTGVSALVLLKAVYPALFALFPPALFGIANRFLSRRFAFVAAAFVVVQSYFFQQLPAIARQEIGLLFFVGLVAAVVDRRLPRGAQACLVALLGAGVVVAHYSTTYLAAAVFGLAVVLQLVVSRFRPLRAMSLAMVVAFVATAGGAGVWYVAVTHSADNVSRVASDLRTHGLDVLPNAHAGQSLVASYLSGNAPASIDANGYERLVARDYARDRPYVHPLHAADDGRFRLQDAPVRADAVRRPGAFEALRTAQVVAGQLFNLLAIAGALALVLRRHTNPFARQLALLGLATLMVLAVVRLSGTTANAYNQERAFVQTMVPLAVGMAWVLERAGDRWRRLRAPVALLAAVALAVMFASTSGLRGVAVGGGTPTNLADAGTDYERFYVTAPELAAAKWIDGAPPRALVYADRYGQLRILGATGRIDGLLLDVTPRTLDRRAWVYAGRTNVVDGRARGAAGSRFATYRWPSILDDHYDTVYANGSARVYHRP
ncbi:MAG TPA: hypothetical protein VGJ32_11815 [Solirubrobacteraceae bacterium]